MNQDQDQVHFPLYNIPYASSSLSCPTIEDRRIIHKEQQFQPLPPQEKQVTSLVMEQCLHDRCAREEHIDELPVKWMSSKMRLMRKMMGEDRMNLGNQGSQVQSNQHECSSSNGIIRVCSNCSTTKTPLWRSGPQGPKSLCNACGIRQMKARRALRAAAAAAASGGLVPASAPKKVPKEERPEVDRTVPFKKRFKIAASSSAQRKLRVDDIRIGLSKKLACHQKFPQEEKEAAILLMALSCGLIHG